MFDNILLQFGALAGFAALVSVLVNVLKYFGVVKDGTADKWVAGFNMLGVLALFVANIFIPDFNPINIDSTLGLIASVGGYIFSTIMTILGSKLTYTALKGLPVVGTSNTKSVG